MFEQYVPDLDGYMEAWNELARNTRDQCDLSNHLDEIVANIYLECTTDVMYTVANKAPAISLIKESYAKVGNTPESREEISEINQKLAILQEKETILRGFIKTEEMKLNLYQTMSANSRNVAAY